MDRSRDRRRDYRPRGHDREQDQKPGLNQLMIAIWVILAVACLGTALVRRYRSRRPQA